MTSQGADKMISRSGVEIKVCGSSKSRAKKRYKRGRSRQVVGKLDEVQVQWIIHEKRNGEMTNKQIAELM